MPRIVEIRDEPDGWLSKGAKTKDSNEYNTKQKILNVLIEVRIKCCGPSGRRKLAYPECLFFYYVCGLFNIEWRLYFAYGAANAKMD